MLDFETLRPVCRAKLAVRMALCFSTSTSTLKVPPDDVRWLADEKRNGHNFSGTRLTLCLLVVLAGTSIRVTCQLFYLLKPSPKTNKSCIGVSQSNRQIRTTLCRLSVPGNPTPACHLFSLEMTLRGSIQELDP